MFPDRLVLLEQINSAIKRNSCNQTLKSVNCADANKNTKDGNELNDKIHYYFSEKNDQLKKLEQRIQTLEEQDDHLLYFVHFLFENFTALVTDILLSCQTPHDIKKLKVSGTEINGKRSGRAENASKKIPTITRREMDVLNLLIKGLCAKEIADNLFISETTVITHKKHLKEKFNARNSAELISKALLISE